MRNKSSPIKITENQRRIINQAITDSGIILEAEKILNESLECNPYIQKKKTRRFALFERFKL